MPCYTPPPTYEETRAHWEKELRHNSPVAEMLCTVIKQHMAEGKTSLSLPKDVRDWWYEHQKRDKAKNI